MTSNSTSSNTVFTPVKPRTTRGPIDFSEFHQQEMARRQREEEENNKWIFAPAPEPAPVQQERRVLTPEEIQLWEMLEDDEDEDMDQEMEEEPPKLDVEFTKKACRDHIMKRLEILKSGREEDFTVAEFESLPYFDRSRIEFVEEYEMDAESIDQMVKNFIMSRIINCPFEEFVIGYKVLLEMYDSLIGPEFYFLSIWEGSQHLHQYERWCLFGY